MIQNINLKIKKSIEIIIIYSLIVSFNLTLMIQNIMKENSTSRPAPVTGD